MPRLTPIHWKVLKCIFEQAGFVYSRTEGDHIALEKVGVKRPVIIPKYDEVGLDIIKSNMRTANMNREKYFKLLAKCK
ncbi:MAG: type II toxin-antitoxin system HicA family toxin [Nitrospirae bacterium]|nr:type II toxin-antitoxin system HicA family toxin [Nitrospirota bacterium]